MKEFARKQGRLGTLPQSARLIYSIFLVYVLIGLGVSLSLSGDMVGLMLQRFDEYYAGKVVEAKPAVEDPESGPVLDLPEDLEQAAPAEPKSLRATLEVTHFHLFSMPLHWLVLAHLFAMSTLADRTKTGLVLASGFAVGAHLAAPWIARMGSCVGGVYYAASGSLLLVTFAVMAIVPLVQMWSGRARSTGVTSD
jgi:hypothetical protein